MRDISETDVPLGHVYGLVASDEPLQIRYVGKCEQSPFHRLIDHLRLRSTNRGFCDWVRQVKGRGAAVRMRILGSYPVKDLARAERHWIVFWRDYCSLFNRALPYR